jgi:hypothetical protein
MALSAKMLALLQKVDAAREEFFVGLRESARREAQVRVEKKKEQMTSAKKKAPMKVPPLRVTSTQSTRKRRKSSPRP